MERQHITEAYMSSLKRERRAADNTVLAYRNDLQQFETYLNGVVGDGAGWGQVTRDHVTQFIAQLNARYSTSTVARKIAALKSLFAWLRANRHIGADPILDLRAPPIARRAPHTLTPDEVVRLMEAPVGENPMRARRDRALLELLYSSGMRVSEVIGLRLADLDLERAEVRCAGRGSRDRVVPLSPRAIVALRDYLAGARAESAAGGPTDYVFLNPAGSSLTRQAVWLMTRQHARAAGLHGEITPHTLRHSRAEHLMAEGENPRRVQEIFGHANIATTQSYRQNRALTVAAPVGPPAIAAP